VAISFKVKLTVAIVLAVMTILIASFELVRFQIQRSFAETLREQYERQIQLTQERDGQRLRSYASEMLNNTSSPRLLAALMEEDFSRFYYDLWKEMEAFHRNLDERYAISGAWPFFRFIREGGHYLSPPRYGAGEFQEATDSLPGILSPFPENELEALLKPLRTMEGQATEPRSGYLLVESSGQPILMTVFVCPVSDAFGMFLGDLILLVPWQGIEITNLEMRAAMIVEGQVFNARGQIPVPLAAALAGAFESGLPESLGIADENYLVFSDHPEVGPHFPEVERVVLFSTNEQDRLLAGIRDTFLVFLIVSFGSSLLLGHTLASGLHAPVLLLKRAAEQIGKGNFATRVQIRSRDELGQLGEAFNEMSEGLEMKEKYKSVLSKVADPQVAERLMQGQVELGGETVQATVLFCDIRGFTALTGRLHPQKVIGMLNTHMTTLTQIVHEYGGVVDKFIGDEIMVLFGVPVPGADDVSQALRCAEAMIAKRGAMNADGECPIEIGIGIAHGEMVAGCMGSEDRLNYTVIGDRVNLAARLCSQAGPMEIVLDQAVGAAAGLEFSKGDREFVELKGFENATAVFRLRPQATIV